MVSIWYIIYDTSNCRTYEFQFSLDPKQEKIIQVLATLIHKAMLTYKRTTKKVKKPR
jgi:hypothetical protein